MSSVVWVIRPSLLATPRDAAATFRPTLENGRLKTRCSWRANAFNGTTRDVRHMRLRALQLASSAILPTASSLCFFVPSFQRRRESVSAMRRPHYSDCTAHKLLRCACSHYWFVHDDDASIDGCLACLLDGTENYCGEFKGLRSSGSLRGVHE